MCAFERCVWWGGGRWADILGETVAPCDLLMDDNGGKLHPCLQLFTFVMCLRGKAQMHPAVGGRQDVSGYQLLAIFLGRWGTISQQPKSMKQICRAD